MNYHDLDTFTQAYVDAALWSSSDNSDDQGGAPLDDNYDWGDIAPETQKQMIEDCKSFQESNRAILEGCAEIRPYADESAGHDFWLTRNHHGAGLLG